MKKSYLLLVVLFLSVSTSYAQKSIFIKDEMTLEPIEFVNISFENSNQGISSNQNGVFSIPEKNKNGIIVLDAVGFDLKRINASEIKDIIYLKRNSIALQEVEVLTTKSKKEYKIGAFKKSDVELYFGTNLDYPWIVARFFESNSSNSENQFLKKIKLMTWVPGKTLFNIRIYSVDENKKPDAFLINENIISTAKKGVNETEIDISDLSIKFPKNGLFIAIENIKPHQELNKKDKNKRNNPITVGLNLESKNKFTYIYHKGEWTDKINSKNIFDKKMLNLFKAIEIELTVAN